MDVNGDGSPDLDPKRIFYFGNSAGAMYGAVFLALEPNIHVAAEGVPGALSPEHARWAPGRPANFLAPQLRDRIPSLLNAPGITMIDGVRINPPHFNENKPLRDQSPLTNEIEGAMDIQNAMELHEWGQQLGQSPVPWVAISAEAPGLCPSPCCFSSKEATKTRSTRGRARSCKRATWPTGQFSTDMISRSPRTPRFQRNVQDLEGCSAR